MTHYAYESDRGTTSCGLPAGSVATVGGSGTDLRLVLCPGCREALGLDLLAPECFPEDAVTLPLRGHAPMRARLVRHEDGLVLGSTPFDAEVGLVRFLLHGIFSLEEPRDPTADPCWLVLLEGPHLAPYLRIRLSRERLEFLRRALSGTTSLLQLRPT